MRVLVVDDERTIRESIARILELEGLSAAAAADGEEAAARLGTESFDAVVADLRMPRMDGQALLEWMRAGGIRTPVVMISAHGEIEDAVRALKSGANDYLVKPFDPAELLLRLRAVVEAKRSEDRAEAVDRTAPGPRRLLGESPAMRDLVALVERAAQGSSTVLIEGESGSGKELVARELHGRSPRRAEPFVAVNLGALPETLAESELFGHERGAFTGAEARRVGLFELAGAGTLFLDEIGEMPPGLQVKLLRALQERRIRRLGGSRDIPTEARIVAATNRDLRAEVAAGRFREDLYYRLDVLRIRVPPLRERLGDLPLLAGAILGRLRARSGGPARSLSAEALSVLLSYRFPGNVRELENILERAVVLSDSAELSAADLGLPTPSARPAREAGGRKGAAGGGERPPAGDPRSMEELEREAIVRALERWKGNRTKAALELGIGRRTILYKIKRYGLDARGGSEDSVG